MNTAKVMPVDLAMHRGLNHHPPFRQLLGMSTRSNRALTRSSTYDCLQPKVARSPQIPSSPVSDLSCTSPCGILKKKKQVVFADDKGLALTAVRIFNSDPQISDVEELSPPVMLKTEPGVQRMSPQLRLGIPQPSADLPTFLESLETSLVRLESCSLICGSLFGKVRVYNISSEKAVHVHITYDSWRSQQDIQCTPIQQKNGSAETELFVFNIPFPSWPSAQDRLEFCVSFRPGSGKTLVWDNNGGRNYQILMQEMNSEEGYSIGKKTLRSQISETPQLLPLRNGPALYKSGSLRSCNYSENMRIGKCSEKYFAPSNRANN